jgi:hypothetical protein
VKADHTDNALIAAIKALDEVVAPAVDETNPLAREQLKLVSRYIGFLRTRLQYQAGRDRFERRHYLALAQRLRPQASDAPIPGMTAFDRAIRLGTDCVDRTDVSTAELRAATAALSTAISMLVRSSAAFDTESRHRVEAAVVSASKTLFDVQRAYYLPLGFEPDPAQVSDLATALDARA